ncbi:MAG: PaaI family thioesterase [Ignavibacteriae bacterium]|nr:PaaI family thioesterase [Ignavibacteriota bacterium]
MKQKVVNKQNNSKMCFVCGMENKLGLKAYFYEMENGELVATFTPKSIHQSYPGRLHGEIASTILDEAIGRAILMKDENMWGVTLELNVKFKKPVPYNEELKVICKITNETSRTFEGEGRIVLANGDVAVTADGKYFKMHVSKITDVDFTVDQWFNVADEKDPEEIEV